MCCCVPSSAHAGDAGYQLGVDALFGLLVVLAGVHDGAPAADRYMTAQVDEVRLALPVPGAVADTAISGLTGMAQRSTCVRCEAIHCVTRRI